MMICTRCNKAIISGQRYRRTKKGSYHRDCVRAYIDVPDTCGGDSCAAHGSTPGLDHILETYTAIKPCVVEGEPDAHNTFLVVEQQSFCMTPYASESKEAAVWMQTMLAKALLKIIQKERA